MLNWLKDKMTKAAANQCKFNIKINTQTLATIANKADARIDEDKKKVHSAQVSLLQDIQLGIANGLTIQEIREVVNEALKGEDLLEGAKIAVEHVLDSTELSMNEKK